MEGVPAGAAGFVSGSSSATTASATAATGQVPPAPPYAGNGSGPNPAVAGILAGFFPFGVGAVYTGQYAKGLAHLAVFALLIAGCSAADNGHSTALGVICGFGIAFFIVYQILDAVRTAKAIQMSQPLPDPFGLGAAFGGGTKTDTSKIPLGAIILIGLGVLFLMNTLGWTEFGLDRFWPLILIGLGVWMFARNWGLISGGRMGCQCMRCRTRRLMGPAMLMTVGSLFLLESLHVGDLGFHRTWPVILLVIGGIQLLKGTASTEGHNPTLPEWYTKPPGGTTPPVPPVPPIPPVPPTDNEVNHV
jgi:hypothetical protein